MTNKAASRLLLSGLLTLGGAGPGWCAGGVVDEAAPAASPAAPSAPADPFPGPAGSVPIGSGPTNFGAAAPGGSFGGRLSSPASNIPMPTAERDMTGSIPHVLVMEAGAGRIMNLPGGAANIFVADPKVVEVRPASSTSLFMFGVAAGRTTVAAMDATGRPVAQFEVTVRPSAYSASEAAAAIARALPGSDIQVEVTPRSLILTGQVRDAGMSERAQSLAAAFADKGQTIDNRLALNSSIQVGLRVRIVEMSRALTRTLGINWQSLGTLGSFGTSGLASAGIGAATLGTSDLNIALDLLSQDNLIHTLAEPNLVTQSGETASFLAGGEYPIPISQNNGAISVDYKQFGVQLSFVPTVLSDRRISLHVRPEVSDISAAGGFTLSNNNSTAASTSTTGASSSASLTVPALTVRRADTTVELGSGQSFAIAGLLQDNVNHSVSEVPFLGDVPVLGALFRSDSFQRTETELVIVVTPYIVKPVSNPMALRGPSYTPPNDIDRWLRMRQLGHKDAMPTTRSTTAAGFLVE